MTAVTVLIQRCGSATVSKAIGGEIEVSRERKKNQVALPEMHASLPEFGWALAAALIIAFLSAVAPLYRLRHMNVAAVISTDRRHFASCKRKHLDG